MTDRTTEILEEIQRLREEQGKLLEALPRSIQIKKIWPEAFEGGCTCAPILTGTSWPNGARIPPFTPTYPEPYERVRTITRTYLRRSDGVEKEISPVEFFSIYSRTLDHPDLRRRCVRGELSVGESHDR